MKRLGTVRRRVGAALAMGSALTVVLTIGVHPTFASWVSTAKLGDSVGVASSSCTTPGVYRTTAASRLLAGSVGGVPLTSSSALAPLTADNDASTVTFTGGAAAQGGDGGTSTVGNAAIAGAVQSAGGTAALSGPSGSQTLYSAATSTGRSVAGAGAVTSSGAIDTAGIAAGTRPAIGTVDVSSVLAAVPGGAAARGSLSQLGLSIGNVASAATLNECARRWGASLSSALTRTTTTSALSLTTKDGALSALLDTVTAQRSNVLDGMSALTGGTSTSTAESTIAGIASTGLVAAVNSALGALLSGARAGVPSASVSIASNSSAATAATTGTRQAAAGLVQLEGSSGTVTANLGKLADLTAPQPNTSLLSASDATAIAAGVATAAGAIVTDTSSGLDAAVNGATVTLQVDVPIALGGTTLANVQQSMSGTLAQVLDGKATWATPKVTVLSGLDGGLLLGALLSPVRTLVIGPVETGIRTAVSTSMSTLSTAQSQLTAGLSDARAALPSELAKLATVFSITLNEQPDVAPYPTAAAGTGGGFVVTALRIRVKVAGADALDLAIASSSVGPDRTINQ